MTISEGWGRGARWAQRAAVGALVALTLGTAGCPGNFVVTLTAGGATGAPVVTGKPVIPGPGAGTPSVLSGAAAEAALGPKRQQLLAELRKQSSIPIEIAVDAASGAILLVDLDVARDPKRSVDDLALEFVQKYPELLDPRVPPRELVTARKPSSCEEVAVFQRVVQKVPVLGSEILFHFSPDHHLTRIVNAVAPVPGKVLPVDAAVYKGKKADPALAPGLDPALRKSAAPERVLVPSAAGDGLHAADLVVWPDKQGFVGAVFDGPIALSGALRGIAREVQQPPLGPAAPQFHKASGSPLPDFMTYAAMGGQTPSALPGDRNAAELVYRFLDEHPALYRTGLPRCQYAPRAIVESPRVPGVQFVRMQQRYAGLPVFESELVFELHDGRRVMSIAGHTLDQIRVPLTPTVSADQAATAMRTALRLQAHAIRIGRAPFDEAALATAAVRLGVFPGPLHALKLSTRLAWEVKLNEFIGYVDALDGTVLRSWTNRPSEIFRINDGQGQPEASRGSFVTEEIDGTATGSIAANTDVPGTRAAAPVVMSTYASLGWSGIDNGGKSLVANTNVAISTGCPNAFERGDEMFYCLGMAVNEVIGHEFTHGVIDHSSRLRYQDESGAINEAYADLMGNLIFPDVITPPAVRPAWLVGEATVAGTFRDMANPPAFGNPGNASAYNTNSAACIAAPLTPGCDNGGVHSNSGIINRAHVLMTDGIVGATAAGPPLTRGIGRPKMLVLGFLTMTTRLGPLSRLNDVAFATRSMCDTLVTRGASALDGSRFVPSDCDQVPLAFTQVGLGADLESGWSEPTLGFSGTTTFFGAGETTATGCAVTNITGSLTGPTGDIPLDFSPATAMASSASAVGGLWTLGFVVPPGATPAPIGTAAKLHAVRWFSAFGVMLPYHTEVLTAAPPPGAADCRTPVGTLPIQRFTQAISHGMVLLPASGSDVAGINPSTMNPACVLRSTGVEILDGGGTVIAGPGPSATHRITVSFLFVDVHFDASATLGAAPAGLPDLSAPVAWHLDTGRAIGYRLRYFIDQPNGVTCTP